MAYFTVWMWNLPVIPLGKRPDTSSIRRSERFNDEISARREAEGMCGLWHYVCVERTADNGEREKVLEFRDGRTTLDANSTAASQ